MSVQKGISVTTYNWERFHCEICKLPYPLKLELKNGKVINLVEYQNTYESYIVLERLQTSLRKKIFVIEGNS